MPRSLRPLLVVLAPLALAVAPPTETATGAVKEYENPRGRLASVADTGAF